MRRINEETRKRTDAETEKNQLRNDLDAEKRKNVERFNENQDLRNQNERMKAELQRVAQKLGGSFLPSQQELKTQKELILENVGVCYLTIRV